MKLAFHKALIYGNDDDDDDDDDDEHIDCLGKLSWVGARQRHLLKAKQLLHKGNYLSLCLSKKPYIFTAKSVIGNILYFTQDEITGLKVGKNTKVCVDRLSDLPQNVKVTRKNHNNSRQME